MAISNYGQLKTAILNWADDTELTAVVADFVRLAEVQIRRDVRTRDQLTAQVGALTDGTAALASNFLEARQLVIDDEVIEYVPEDVWVTLPNAENPQFFTVDGDSIKVQGGGTDSYTLTYWEKYADLSADSDTNWLLTNAPDVYLWGSVAEAYAYTRDPEGETYARNRYNLAVQGLNATEKRSLIAGPMRIRTA
jgi:hypothetical protein